MPPAHVLLIIPFDLGGSYRVHSTFRWSKVVNTHQTSLFSQDFPPETRFPLGPPFCLQLLPDANPTIVPTLPQDCGDDGFEDAWKGFLDAETPWPVDGATKKKFRETVTKARAYCFPAGVGQLVLHCQAHGNAADFWPFFDAWEDNGDHPDATTQAENDLGGVIRSVVRRFQIVLKLALTTCSEEIAEFNRPSQRSINDIHNRVCLDWICPIFFEPNAAPDILAEGATNVPNARLLVGWKHATVWCDSQLVKVIREIDFCFIAANAVWQLLFSLSNSLPDQVHRVLRDLAKSAEVNQDSVADLRILRVFAKDVLESANGYRWSIRERIVTGIDCIDKVWGTSNKSSWQSIQDSFDIMLASYEKKLAAHEEAWKKKIQILAFALSILSAFSAVGNAVNLTGTDTFGWNECVFSWFLVGKFWVAFCWWLALIGVGSLAFALWSGKNKRPAPPSSGL